MNSTQLNPPTYPEYSSYPLVWKPQPTGDQSLFLVRVPPDLPQMSWQHYLTLMQLRVQWMICTAAEPQIQIQQQLETALATLTVSQEPPSLYEISSSRELAPPSLWAMTWAEALINLNDTWKTKFEIENEAITFPCLVSHPRDRRIQQQWREEHDEMGLESWLADLTYGMDA